MYKLRDVGTSTCSPWRVNKTSLHWDCGVPLVFPLHFTVCFTSAITLLARGCFASLCPTPLLPSVSSWKQGLCRAVCPAPQTRNKSLYWQEVTGVGWYVQEFLWKPEEHCFPCHMVEDTQHTHFQPVRQSRINLLGTYRSSKVDSLNVTPFCNTTHTKMAELPRSQLQGTL